LFGFQNKTLERRAKIRYKVYYKINRLTGSCSPSRTEGVFPREKSLGNVDKMDINKMLAELRTEREQLEEAIMTLERLARGRGKRRGRPPAWMSQVKRRGRPPGSKNRPKSESKGATAKTVSAAA
jgi:hypothetical protein